MPLKGFKYPNGDKIEIEEVRGGKVDIERMGIALPTLLHMAEQRDPKRKPSTTELLNGTCQSYLQRTEEYYIDPQENAFSLAGTLHHLKLETAAEEIGSLKSELSLEHFDITGTLDLYDSKNKYLIDYKNVGSYKVVQLLGLQYNTEDHPTDVYLKSGRWGKKGTPKKVKVFYENPESADFGDWKWQLNFYRFLLEKNGYPVEKMFIQATVRDGGVQVATSRGVNKNIYLVEVPFIHDDHLVEKFLTKRDALLQALENRELPDKCNDDETWGGNKCKRYCEVREICPYVNKGDIW